MDVLKLAEDREVNTEGSRDPLHAKNKTKMGQFRFMHTMLQFCLFDNSSN